MARDRDIDLNEAGSLPASDCSFEGGTNGAAAPVRALRRGYLKRDSGETFVENFGPAVREDDDGSTYTEGDPVNRGGFLDRPQGWER